MVIYMDQYRKARIAQAFAAARCRNQEKLCVNSSPASVALTASSGQGADNLSPQLPEDFGKVDLEAFQDRVYALATQI